MVKTTHPLNVAELFSRFPDLCVGP
jgi:hypothetical protein